MLESKSSALTNLATPLHGSMVFTINRYMSHRTLTIRSSSGRPSPKWMNGQIAALTNLPARWGFGQFRFLRPLRHFREYRTSGAGHPGFQSLGAEPFDGFGDRGAKPLGNRLQVVVAEAENLESAAFGVLGFKLFAICSKARDYSNRSCALKLRRRKN